MSEPSPRGVSTREKKRRLFFALWPTETRQHEIASAMRRRVEASCGRAIPAENLHVTLAFVGSVLESRFERVVRCGAEVSGARFHLELDQIEIWARAHVLCLTPRRTPPELAHIAEHLRFKLLSEQFEIRQEEYRPHMTLARDVRRRDVREPIGAIAWNVDDFVLVESRPGRAGSEYKVIERWPLSGSC